MYIAQVAHSSGRAVLLHTKIEVCPLKLALFAMIRRLVLRRMCL